MFSGIFMIKKLLIYASFFSMMASNIFLITNSAYHSLLSNLLEKVPIEGLLANSPSRIRVQLEADNNFLRRNNDKLEGEKRKYKDKIKGINSISRRIAGRTVRNVTTDIGEFAFRAAPYIGLGFILVGTAQDIKDGCDTVNDVNQILDVLETEETHEDTSKVCGVKIPAISLAPYQGTLDGMSEQFKRFEKNVGGAIYEIVH